MTPPQCSRRKAFALVELLAVAGVVLIGGSLLVVASADSRRHARLGSDLSDLSKTSGLTSAYAADNQDKFWSFTWRRTGSGNPQNPSQYPDLQFATSDLDAGACQAVDILRRRGGRTDIPRINGWFAHALYGHLMLQDYAASSLPDLTFVSAGDEHRARWAQDPLGFDAGRFNPVQPAPSPTNKRWPYSASYLIATAWYDQGPVGNRVYSAGQHNQYFIPGNVVLGGQPLASVAHPAQKVMTHDQGSWHFGRRAAFALAPAARATMLLADGSADVRCAADSNQGWQPNQPQSPSPTLETYQPSAWEPPTTNGQSSEQFTGRFKWTREGIRGRDFGGPEVGP